MRTKVYSSSDNSRIVNAWDDISPYFTPEEIFSPDTIHTGRHLIDLGSIRFLNEFRERIGPLKVNHAGLHLRGVRSPKEQIDLEERNSNAAELSMHVCGKAFDVSSNEHQPHELADLAERFGWHAIGIYGTFCHLDMRTLYTPKPVVFIRG